MLKTLFNVVKSALISLESKSITTITPATVTKVACSSLPLFCNIWQATLTTRPTPAIFKIKAILNFLFLSQ